MTKSARMMAEKQFSASQKKEKLAQKEKERARLERVENTARLRALRIAKEAEENKTVEAAKPKAAKPKAAKLAHPDLPQAHRR
ncbi:MAG: hypothetical protein OQJ99_00885 [Rhodospirillales bacterium]|nr:hypothetical protein [Rhodospirillales bacterium]MCW8862512.1 hypothetical protein [Rhodospirillales bacterium]MCW8951070.1 hypothetical protein [Rhodospirillales bacterium]MCW8970118.1 hypothetical protein [Rhodospirillales bacterium]MCW9002367.1 hypothetical protein [Rhodospirillales bacterium]